MKKYHISIYVEGMDGQLIAENLGLAETIKLVSGMSSADIIYVSTDNESVSLHLQADGSVKLDLDDCAEESIAEYQQIEKAVNLYRTTGVVERGATAEEMKRLWEAREEYARLSKLMSEDKIQWDDETVYWELRTIEKLVLYGCNDA